MLRTSLIVMLACFALADACSAQTTRPTLTATLGFDNDFKPDNWTPIYAHIADADAPRSATLEVRTARGKLGHDVIARIVTSRTPTTYTIYAPVGYLDRLSLQLRDDAGRLLTAVDLTDTAAATPAALGGPVIGVAGNLAESQRVATQITRATGEFVASGAVPLALLAERAIGYSGVDCLVLPSLDADAMDEDVQRAIVSWVRSGGILVTWPGAQAPTQRDAPLVQALPATIGLPAAMQYEGYDLVGRELTPTTMATLVPADAGPGDKKNPPYVFRRLGLGQIVLLSADPTLLDSMTAADRIKLWRTLTDGQLTLLPEERRAGVFDSLTTQAVAEQQLKASPAAQKSTLATLFPITLLAGLLVGPAELVFLAATGRHPRTWYTLTGLGLCVVCTLWWLAEMTTTDQRRMRPPRIDVRVEAPDGLAALVELSQGPNPAFDVTWLTADRTDPSVQPASEVLLAQHGDRYDVAGFSNLGGTMANFRAIRFTGPVLHPADINADVGALNVTNPTKLPWASIAIVSKDTVRLLDGDVAPRASASLGKTPTTLADNPSTRRIETGIERLAADPGWAAILMDRRLAERLVRLLETEPDTTIVATRDARSTSFTLQVIR